MISVIFITHNRKDELIRSIRTCFEQTYKEIEIIIIDNASEINIKKTIDTLMKEYEFRDYQYIYNDENLGVAGGRNLGFKLAKGEYCFFLDDDAVLTEKTNFEKAIIDFEKNDSIAAIACEIYQPIDNTYLDSVHIENDEVSTYVGAAHFIKSSIWKNHTLYPDNIIYGSEEMYSSLYIRKKGFNILYDREIKVSHLPSQINRTCGKNRDFNIIVNTFICRKYFYPFAVTWFLYFTLFLHLAKNGLLWNTNIRLEIKKRYKKEYEDKMSLKSFIKLCKHIGVKNIF